jgi:hypothetical protein
MPTGDAIPTQTSRSIIAEPSPGGLAPEGATSSTASDRAPASTLVVAERRDALQRSRLAAVIAIAVLNTFDLITTYVAIAAGAHEANPVVAWMISSRLVIVFKVAICASLIIGALFAKRRRRRVTLTGLCTAWAVVGVYSLVVVINTLTVWAHLR